MSKVHNFIVDLGKVGLPLREDNHLDGWTLLGIE